MALTSWPLDLYYNDAVPNEGCLELPPSSGAGPEIILEGNGVAIADGDTTPVSADCTAFGRRPVASGAVTRTFVIRNTGPASLDLRGTPKVALTGPAAGDFSVTAQPVSPVAAGGSATFKVRFDPSAAGSRQAVLIVANDDSDEDPYDFALPGTGVAATQ